MSYYEKMEGTVTFKTKEQADMFMKKLDIDFDFMKQEDATIDISGYNNNITDYFEEQIKDIFKDNTDVYEYYFNVTGEDDTHWILKKDFDSDTSTTINGFIIYPEDEEKNIDKMLDSMNLNDIDKKKLKTAIINYSFDT